MSACPNCDAMRREIGALRASLGLAGDASIALDLRTIFRLTAAEARLLTALFEAGAQVVPYRTLRAVIDPSGTALASTLRVHIYRLRTTLGGHAIQTVRQGGGYRLSDDGRLLVGTKLAALRARRAMA